MFTIPHGFFSKAAGGEVELYSIEMQAAVEDCTFDCDGPVASLFWNGTVTVPVWVNYDGDGDIEAAVSLTAEIVSLTPTGGSDPVTGPGSITAGPTFVSDGAVGGEPYARRAIYEFTYQAPMIAGSGSQTADINVRILDGVTEVDASDLASGVGGSFNCGA